MRNLITGTLIASMAALAACAGSEQASSNKLGITEVTIEKGDTSLWIVAWNAQQAKVGTLSLVFGPFTNPELGDGILDGRSMEVEVLGKRVSHQSNGRGEVLLPLEEDEESADMNAFLFHDRVRSELALWGVRVELLASAGEAESPYYTCNPTPNSACGPTACFQVQSALPSLQKVCCGVPHLGLVRSCQPSPGAGQSTNCGPTGPAGCAVCFSKSYTNSCVISGATIYVDGVKLLGSTTCTPGAGACTSSAECCSGYCSNNLCAADIY